MSRITSKRVFGLALLPVFALGACTVAPPTGPTVVGMPGQGKSFAQFQQDDNYCRNYAQSKTTDAAQVSNDAQVNGNRTAVAGTLIGAAAGAVLGAVAGNAGAGAAIGAGAGLLGGASVAGNNTQAAADSLQGRYDVGNGEAIQQAPAPAYYGAPPPAYYGPPPGYYPGY
jgi:outer membrane lipoprotein SlyB